MSRFLLLNNIHLGVELFGAIVFVVASWLYFHAYVAKRDKFSLGRALGFVILTLGQIFHAVGVGLEFVYLVGLILIFLSFWLEKMPPKPNSFSAFFGWVPPAASLVLFCIVLVLIRRYVKDLDKQVKWLLVGFLFLAVSTGISGFADTGTLDSLWVLEHLFKIMAFLAISSWIYVFLSLRIREEASIVFVSISLFTALLITTTFSSILLRKTENEAYNNLTVNARSSSFYIESLKNKALAASQIIANNEDFIWAIRTKDLAGAEVIGKDLIVSTGQNFLSVAETNGNIFFKLNSPLAKGENILVEQIGGEALEGRPVVTIEKIGEEGFSIRAAAPIFDRGRISGAVLTGFLLSDSFVGEFKKLTDLEVTLFVDDKVFASSFLNRGDVLDQPFIKNKVVTAGEEFVGNVRILNQEIIGAFLPLRNLNDKVVGVMSLTTTPLKLLEDVQTNNRLTIFVVFLIVLILFIPLYRFTVFLTTRF